MDDKDKDFKTVEIYEEFKIEKEVRKIIYDDKRNIAYIQTSPF